MIEIEEIDEKRSNYYFKGKIMYISDPKRVQLLVSNRKDRGELLDEFVKKHNALGIVNASGFSDPDGYGNGVKAFGLLIKDGKILQNYNAKGGETALGITFDGKLITGNYTAQQLVDMGVKDAMSFRPQLIVNGKICSRTSRQKAGGFSRGQPLVRRKTERSCLSSLTDASLDIQSAPA